MPEVQLRMAVAEAQAQGVPEVQVQDGRAHVLRECPVSVPKDAQEGKVAAADFAVFNPHGKPVDELPIIYGFNNGGGYGFMSGVLLAQDGYGLGGHLCTHEGYMLHDLGILEGTRLDRHETFKRHYPGGYRMEFVSQGDVKNHAGLMEAYRLNQELAAKAKDAEGDAAARGGAL